MLTERMRTTPDWVSRRVHVAHSYSFAIRPLRKNPSDHAANAAAAGIPGAISCAHTSRRTRSATGDPACSGIDSATRALPCFATSVRESSVVVPRCRHPASGGSTPLQALGGAGIGSSTLARSSSIPSRSAARSTSRAVDDAVSDSRGVAVCEADPRGTLAVANARMTSTTGPGSRIPCGALVHPNTATGSPASPKRTKTSGSPTRSSRVR